jgi:hypothetical protein
MQRLHRISSLIGVAFEEALRSLRLNLIPGLLLQGLMIVLAAAYCWIPDINRALMHLGYMKDHWGLLFSFVGTSAASSFLPELLRPFLTKSARPAQEPPLLSRLLFAIPFWGLIGMQVDLFYRLQFLMFGPSDSLLVIVAKVVVDAFLYCPLLAIPEAVCVFLWKDHEFTHRGFRGWTPLRFYALKIFPVLMTNWMVWIPVVSIIYSLPSALGIPLFIIAQAFWVMVFTTLSSRKA